MLFCVIIAYDYPKYRCIIAQRVTAENVNLDQYNQQYAPNIEPPVPPRRQLDAWSIGVIAAGGLAVCMCLVALCVGYFVIFREPPPKPVTPQPTIDLAQVFTPIPSTTPIPTLDTSKIGIYYNPFFSAGLESMTSLTIDVLDPASGNYTRAVQLVGDQLAPFIEALNVSVLTEQPDPACPNHVRFTATTGLNQNIVFGACLKDGTVIIRGTPDLGGADAPMYPGFTQALVTYVPDAYKRLLGF
jgi:hypothetical protein